MSKPLRRIAAVVCAALLASLVAGPVAAADYKAGRYAGTTSQGESISFKAKRLGVKKFDYTVIINCADGSQQAIDGSGGSAPVSDAGKFSALFVGQGITSEVRGKLKRKQAEGKIDTVGTAPSGAPCSSVVDWSAKSQ